MINRANNMGDALCHMRALKEYKEANPDLVLDFATCHYLHYLMASHTDLFGSIRLLHFSEVTRLAIAHPGYERVIEFEIDWVNACQNGILRAWCEKTLGFVPSTDRPYYLVREEEHIIAAEHAAMLRRQFRKLAILQPTAPSGYVRSFRREDIARLESLFPSDVAVLAPGPIDGLPYPHAYNVIPLPGYDVGTMAALLSEVDYTLGTHGGTIMLAHAVGATNVTQVMFGEGGTPQILRVAGWDNLYYESHNRVDWDELAAVVKERLC